MTVQVTNGFACTYFVTISSTRIIHSPRRQLAATWHVAVFLGPVITMLTPPCSHEKLLEHCNNGVGDAYPG